jgi:hypothetical protein
MATDLNDEEEPNPAAGTSGRSADYPLPADVGSSKGSDAPLLIIHGGETPPLSRYSQVFSSALWWL